MSSEFERFRREIRQELDWKFDALNQALTLVRDSTAKRLEEQEQTIRQALSAQRSIIEDSYGGVLKAFEHWRAGTDDTMDRVLEWLNRLDDRVTELERKAAG